MKIIIAWLLISHFGYRIFEKFENVIYVLGIISLFFWVWQVFNEGSLHQIMSFLDLSGSLNEQMGIDSKYIIVYSKLDSGMPSPIPRNCGFTWEPGPFSCYIIIALFINLARSNFKIKGNKRLPVYLIVIFSTQSTTGLLGLLALILWTTYNIFPKKYILIGGPIAIGIIIYLFVTVPVLQQKIIHESEQDIEIIIRDARRYGYSVNPGRFASFKLGLKDFKNYPLTGYGGNVAARYASRVGVQVGTINGIAHILSRYGLFGISFFLLFIILTGKRLAIDYNYRLSWIFPLIMLIISFSFGLFETPLLFSMCIFYYFLPKYYYGQQQFNENYSDNSLNNKIDHISVQSVSHQK
jgi:hypothetical protein